MQGLPHHLQSSLVQNNMFGMDNAHRNLDEPNPDMLLALLARNKALEGELPCGKCFIISIIYMRFRITEIRFVKI